MEAHTIIPNFIIPQPKHMLWILKRNISLRQVFFSTHSLYYENNIQNLKLKSLLIFKTGGMTDLQYRWHKKKLQISNVL